MLVSLGSSRGGYQPKRYNPKTREFIKTDFRGGEALAEVLVSLFLKSCWGLEGFPFVSYTFGSSLKECVSKDFLGQGDGFFTFLQVLTPKEERKFLELTSFSDKFQFIEGVYKRCIGYAPREFLIQLVTLDVMFRNTDRHLANFGLILGQTGEFRIAPVFDNGLALGVSEGVYWDLANLQKGWGYKIKPYDLTVLGLSGKIKPDVFQFDVTLFLHHFDRRIPKSNLLLGFLCLIEKYYPKDCYGRDTGQALRSFFGDFNRKRWLS